MNDVHNSTGMQHGPITFVIVNKNKIVGTTKCGFRGFAYIGDSFSDAKRSIVNEYKERKRLDGLNRIK